MRKIASLFIVAHVIISVVFSNLVLHAELFPFSSSAMMSNEKSSATYNRIFITLGNSPPCFISACNALVSQIITPPQTDIPHMISYHPFAEAVKIFRAHSHTLHAYSIPTVITIEEVVVDFSKYDSTLSAQEQGTVLSKIEIKSL